MAGRAPREGQIMRQKRGRTNDLECGREDCSSLRSVKMPDRIATKTQRPRILLLSVGKFRVVQLPGQDSNL